jgi:phage repressor protein C with HTH and peptisase S24 domain
MSTKISSCDNNISSRLKTVREYLGLSQGVFAEIIGIRQNTYSDLETGKTEPSLPIISAICYRYPIDEAWLKSGEGEMKREEVKGKLPEGFVLVPRYEVSASAGGGAVIHSEQIVDHLVFKSEWIRNALGVSVKDLALISVKGDSMEPTLSNGDLILIDIRINHVEDNAIYVLQFKETLLVKRVQRKFDGSVVIISDNLLYASEELRNDAVDRLNVIGRVVWCGRRM